MVIQDYLCCVNWSDESVVARATPSCWESFTPKQLVAKETFFTDDSSPADVSMDTAITNVDSKEASVIDHLHASENILIAFLIAVTSRLDAVVTCTNVL